jgi:2-octaprenylphenol hydroxylase
MNVSGARYEVVVVGAGPVGLATALLLVRQCGLSANRVAIVDRRMPDTLENVRAGAIDLRVFALSRASERILEACDAWSGIIGTRAQPYERMQVWHADVPPHGGDVLVFDAAEMGERDLGVIVENNVLQAALAEAARRTGIAMLEGDVTALEQGEDAISLNLRTATVSGRLVIGADGAQSRVRELAGLATARTDYGQTALVAMVRTARPHANTAWQRFLEEGTLAFLPLQGGLSSIVWSVPTARAERLLGLSTEAFERELTDDFDDALGEVRLASERVKFPLWRLSAHRYIGSRVVLVGDAAHVVHPLAGQGANLGLLDAAALADVLAAGLAQREDPGAERLLRRYERWRRSENDLMAAAIDAFGRMLARREGRLAALAQRGMPWVGRSGVAKRLFIERAMGLAGELPTAASR